MIAVVADDLTGAVEIAGAGLRYGLTVEIVSTPDQLSDAELLVIATDTRSLPEPEAIKTMADITAKLKTLNPQFIFKKVDSVLRGHVVAELNTHLQQLGLKKALVVPANPALGRILTNGNYFVDGQPIHLSSFANDPEFAITGNDVLSMLHCEKHEVAVKTISNILPETGITIGECITENDLKQWAEKADSETLLAGGSGFFAAVLELMGYVKQQVEYSYVYKKPVLFVCGSTFDKSRLLVKQLKDAGGPVSYMPQAIVNQVGPAEILYHKWAAEVATLLNKHDKAIVAIAEDAINASPASLRQKQALLVQKVFENIAVKELLIEGGATASAIIKQLDLTRFTPVQEFSTGVIRMKATQKDGLFLTLKPGSYTWPAQVWDL